MHVFITSDLIVVDFRAGSFGAGSSGNPTPLRKDRSALGSVAFPWGRCGCARTGPGVKPCV
jgi:hypothetical protein